MNIDKCWIGDKKAFGRWKLIWIDELNQVHLANISAVVATALIHAGLAIEG